MTSEEAFKKLMTLFRSNKLTPKQLGSLTRQYFERYHEADTYDWKAATKIMDGKLPFIR